MIFNRDVVQIVSHFSPTACGVGDYTRLLAAEWQMQRNIHTRIWVADEEWPGSPPSEVWEANRLQWLYQKKWAGLNEVLPLGIVLQYSGYGYARRGAPLWLLRTLRSLRRHLPQVPLITMFHEVAAKGPVNTSAFWLRPLQLYVAQRLWALSDMAMTNCEINARALKSLPWLKGRNLAIQPVHSNFGELDAGVLYPAREPRIVVFNSNFGGRMPPASFWQELSYAVNSVNATGVTMIGRPVSMPPDLGFTVEQPGFLAPEEVSAILANAAFGYVFHGPLLLGKSGVFAAFAAHGIAPLIQTTMEQLPDGLVNHRTYHALGCEPPAQDDAAYFEQISRNVREWYLPHSLAATTEVYAELLDRCRTAAGAL